VEHRKVHPASQVIRLSWYVTGDAGEPFYMMFHGGGLRTTMSDMPISQASGDANEMFRVLVRIIGRILVCKIDSFACVQYYLVNLYVYPANHARVQVRSSRFQRLEIKSIPIHCLGVHPPVIPVKTISWFLSRRTIALFQDLYKISRIASREIILVNIGLAMTLRQIGQG